MLVIGTLHPSCAVANPKLAAPTMRSPGLHAAGIGVVTTVVVGIVAGLLIHGTLTVDAEAVIEEADTFGVGVGERAVDEPHADNVTADMRKARDLAVRFLLIFVEV